MLQVKDRELVIPGQIIGEDLIFDLNCYSEGGIIYSAVEGMVRVEGRRVKVVPSTGGYVPKTDDVVIGVVVEVLTGKWLVDIDCPYVCAMRGEEMTRDASKVDLRRYFDVGDVITAKVGYVNEVYSCDLVKPWKMENGLIIEVNPKRIPRVVGKQKSMLNLIREKTGSRIIVGQNGKIWLKDGDVDLAVKTIKKIEKYAQTQGLTDKIAASLDAGRMR